MNNEIANCNNNNDNNKNNNIIRSIPSNCQ